MQGLQIFCRSVEKITLEKCMDIAHCWLQNLIVAKDGLYKPVILRRRNIIDWRALKKIDAHIHILPDTVHEANADILFEAAIVMTVNHKQSEENCNDKCTVKR